jgi:hypothetical protein
MVPVGVDQADVTQALETLRSIATVELTVEIGNVSDGADALENLRNTRQQLRNELLEVRDKVRETRLFELQRSGYQREATEQRARLSPIGLLPETGDVNSDRCPICESTLPHPVPRLGHLRAALEALDGQLRAVDAESPRVQRYLVDLQTQEQTLVTALEENQRSINAILQTSSQLAQQQNELITRARVQGRIEHFLETLSVDEEESASQQVIDILRTQIADLETELDPIAVQDNVDTFMSFINDYLTEYAGELSLEYSSSHVRIDLRKLVVVADTLNGPVTMDRMGSGENWVGYHVAAHLALHRWFRQRLRPVPGFLILDQPSQAHYPPDQDAEGSLDRLSDADKRAVTELFQLITNVATSLSPSLQIIVLDHAKLDEAWFVDAIVEEWRGDEALIPRDWMEDDEGNQELMALPS